MWIMKDKASRLILSTENGWYEILIHSIEKI